MSFGRSLSADLYENATRAIDVHYMDLMRGQDQTPVATDSSRPRLTLLVGPSPFTMMRGWEFFIASPYEGVTYIATVLHNAGYPVRIVDVRYARDPLREAYDQIVGQTDVLGIATFEDNFPFVQELIAKVKDTEPSLPVICGGSLVTSVPHVYMEHTQMDVAVISEGELTILELMDAFTRGEWPKRLPEIGGIWYRDSHGHPQKSRPRGQMPHLDCLPRMNLGLWPQAQDPRGLQPQIIASYSRGCKLDCSFCYRTTPQERVKSAAKLDADLAHLKETYGVNFVMFVDLTFTAHKQKTMEVCEVLEGHNLRWGCMTRCTDVDPERLTAMAKAGADINLYGVESLGKAALKTARKANTESATLRAMHQTWDAGIRFGGLIIIGLPGETTETLNHACEWAEAHQTLTRVKYLSAMPGTRIYRQGLADGLIQTELDHLNWLSIEQALPHDEFVNFTDLDEVFLRRCYDRMYESYLPGPVMAFSHFPENFDYFLPSTHDGPASTVAYAGAGWRAEFSTAGPCRVPGWERFTRGLPGARPASARSTSALPLGAAVSS